MDTSRKIALIALLTRVEEEYKLYDQGNFYDSDIDYDRTHGALKTALYGFADQSEEIEAMDLFWEALSVLEMTNEVPQRPKEQTKFKEIKNGTLAAVKKLKAKLNLLGDDKTEKNPKELLINLLEAGESLISADTATIASDAWSGVSDAMDALLKVSEAFISDSEALETVKAISKGREECSTFMKEYEGRLWEAEGDEKLFLMYERLEQLESKLEEA
jgi:hypothetical protein